MSDVIVQRQAASGTLGTVRDLISLTKPRITLLVVITTAGGLWLAPGALSAWTVVVTLLATAIVVASANALNCWMERDSDRLMARTKNRPLPAGRLEARVALIFGAALGVASVPVLTFGVNPLTGMLASIALASYVWVYTPLKQKSWTALLVGAVPGALPPLMGWTAATGRLDLPGVVLFAVLFVWQIPHFIAIALFRREDYERAGIRVLPAVLGDRSARWHAVVWAGILLPVTLLLYPLGVAGVIYLVVAGVLGSAFFGMAVAGLRRDAGRPSARRLFLASLVHLTVLFAVLMIDAGG